jgi:hypothetical protein
MRCFFNCILLRIFVIWCWRCIRLLSSWNWKLEFIELNWRVCDVWSLIEQHELCTIWFVLVRFFSTLSKRSHWHLKWSSLCQFWIFEVCWICDSETLEMCQRILLVKIDELPHPKWFNQ